MSAMENTSPVVFDETGNSTLLQNTITPEYTYPPQNTGAPQTAAKSFVSLLDENITELIDLDSINGITEIHSPHEQTDDNEWNWLFDFTH
jgi:hypothetical protein